MLGLLRPRRLLVLLLLVVVALNWTYGRLPAEPKRTGSFMQIGKLRVRYLERPGAGTPVLLIHGLPGTAEDFEEVTPMLAGHRTIAIDRPGFGYSSGGYVPFDTQIQTIHELLQRLHIARAILVGHSYGGTVSLGFAERHPSEVQGLVLVDAAAAGEHLSTFDQVQAHLAQALQAPVVRQIANATFSQLLLTVLINRVDDEAFRPQPVAAAHHNRVLAVNTTHGDLQALAGEQLAANGVIKRIDAKLAALAVPAVVIQGDHDELVKPVHGRRLAATLPYARLVMVSGGHMPPYTHPDAIAAAVQSLPG
ncbi:MAG TPA: alpha/beta hydrolase [Solirubrobacteraceae bacterium]|nr:alpha/beta hydrolase [Solirubrobacteraceae bacterium]